MITPKQAAKIAAEVRRPVVERMVRTAIELIDWWAKNGKNSAEGYLKISDINIYKEHYEDVVDELSKLGWSASIITIAHPGATEYSYKILITW